MTIEIRDLSFEYRPGKPALSGLDLELGPGKIVGLVGENGCGKTTMLKILAGVLAGYHGEVRIAGHRPGATSKSLVSFSPDEGWFPRRDTVQYCMGYYADFYPDFDRDKAASLIGSFGLETNVPLAELSKGMREKVQIALTMARQAEVYLLDEPISGVDPASRDIILQTILTGVHEDALVVMSTLLIHDLEPILDSVVMMRHGRVLLSGDVEDLRAERRLSIDQLFKEVYS